MDDVFGGHTVVLEGSRLETLVNFVEVVGHTHPTKATRDRLLTLREALNRRDHWREAQYSQLLREWGHSEPPPTGADVAGAPSLHYRWCRNNEPGAGGYPCGLWLLFHTMLANSDGRRAHLTLQIIFDWTQAFYGCVECAANFAQEWEEEGGENQFGHVQTSIWLWRVHNMVRARLTADDDTISPKAQWPGPADCKNCFNNDTLGYLGLAKLAGEEGKAPPPAYVKEATAAGAKLVEWDESVWDNEYIFSYLQETFCAASDTFVCAGFNDVES